MAISGFDTNVSWSDFTQVPSRPNGVQEDAEIHAQFPYSYALGRNKNAIIVSSADMNISVNSNTSWVVDSQKTSDLLSHEQGHYDITALGAREFYNRMLTLKNADESKLKSNISDERAKFQAKINRTNIRYDNQTNHSQDAAKQQAWLKQIATEKQKPDGSIDNLPQ